MPELPEVETIRRGLGRLIVGKTVASVHNYNSPKSFPNSHADVEQFLIGATITDVKRRAKMLLIELSKGYTLMVHLKMTGQLVFVGTSPLPSLSSRTTRRSLAAGPVGRSVPSSEKSEISSEAGAAPPTATRDSLELRWGGGHPSDSLVGALPASTTREHIEFTDGSRLYFNDLRKFGYMTLVPTGEVMNTNFMKRVGPEPLDDSFTHTEFIPRMRRRNNTNVKAAILDQSVLAGVGNIYADESLWAAKIHPATRVRDIDDARLALLLTEIKKVLTLSIEKGGSTDKNYVDAEGNKGSYLKFANVFRLEGHPCPRCNTEIVKIRIAGRGTHICPHCQIV